MGQKEAPDDFYERVLEGPDNSKTIVLPHKTGAELHDVKMTAVEKKEIADAIGDMPDELFEAAEEGDVDPEEAEEMARQHGNTAAIDGSVIEGFENLCIESLEHAALSKSQMKQIVSEQSFQGLFQLGSEVLNFSIENSGDIEGFREQN